MQQAESQVEWMRPCSELWERGGVAFPDNNGNEIGGCSAENSNAETEPGIASGEAFTTAERRGVNSKNKTCN